MHHHSWRQFLQQRPRQPGRETELSRQNCSGRFDLSTEDVTGFQTLHKTNRFVVVFECAFLNRRRDEWIAPLPADEGFHFFGAAAFQAENAESCKRHVFERGTTFLQSKT